MKKEDRKCGSAGFSLKNCLVFFLVFFLFILKSIQAQTPQNTSPTYTHLSHVDLPTVSTSELNSDDLTIAIATGPQNFVYVLTFGSGVQKRDADGNLVKSNFITGLSSPFDIAVDEDGFIYIADFFAGGDTWADNGQVKIYDSNGNYIRSILTSYFRPMGIDVDENYVYIAEYNDGKKGPESTPSSRIRIVDKATGAAIKVNNNVTLPYRIANDSKGNVYVSQEGGGSPGVYIFDSNLSPKGKLSNIQSPGSVVIDDFDFIHVIEYAGRIDFGKFITSTDDFFYLYGVAHTLYDAVQDQVFGVKIFSPNYQFKTFYKEEIHFPLDIAFNHCDRMYIDDSEIFGTHVDEKIGFIRIHTFAPSKLEFDLEIYQRTPAFDITPPEITCPNSFEQNTDPGKNYATVTYSAPTASDACGYTLELIDGLASGSQFPIGDTKVTYQATDNFSNSSTCSFIVTVKASAESPTFDCPDPNQRTVLELDENCDYIVPDYSGKITNFQHFTSTPYFVQSSTRSGNILNVTIEVFDGEGGDKVGECSFPVDLEDQIPPTVTCPETIKVPYTDKKEYQIPDFTADIVITDNCSESFTITQTPKMGTIIDKDTTVELTVLDEKNNQSGCNFKIEFFKETKLEILNCPGAQTFEVDDNCAYLIPDIAKTIETNIPEANVTQSIGAGFEVHGSLTLTITAKFEDQTATCEVKLIAEDNILPTINCPGDQTEIVAAGEGFKLPNYVLQATYNDNCYVASLKQEPDVQTVIYQTTEVTLYAVDGSGNESSCSFMVNLEEAEAPKIDCITNYSVYSNENCEYFVPDFSEILSYSPSGAVITQDPEAGALIDPNSDPYITVTATYNDKTDNCNVYLEFKDDTDPMIDCPGNQTVSIAPNTTYSLPDYTSQVTVSDNCGMSQIIQEPAEGTEVTSDTEIKITAVDDAGNSDFCTFQLQINIVENLAINCPGDKEFSFDENCAFELPDFTGEAEVINGNGLQVSQSPSPGTIITSENTEIELSVEKDGEKATCSFTLNLSDKMDPVVICKNGYEINLQEGETITLDAAELDNGSYDNCSESLSFSMNITQFTASDEGEVPVILTATDEAGNSGICETTVKVIVDRQGNQPPTARDDNYETLEGVGLNVNSSEGVLKNDSDPESDPITAILDTDVSHGDLQLNEDGSFEYTPETGFFGQDFFTYHVSDGQNNSETAMVTITVVPDDFGDFTCAQEVVLALDEDGEAALNMEDLYFGNADGSELSVSQQLFSCDDIGENTIVLSYSGRNNGSCEIRVQVVDEKAPVLKVKNIGIDLNEQGVATIDFAGINNGSYDNCDGKVTYTLSKYVFTCMDLGENTVEVTAEDNNGNISHAQVVVKVFAEAGICDKPGQGSDYIFIYPNPNSGEFKVATPADISISRIEVFDNRGRFISSKAFTTEENSYEMILIPLEEGVYVLNIITNKGKVIRRLIYKR
ncbi:hypothetical protein C7S20_00460 [Christiangramia fulva]|uniref:HYR domain-containing protein n=1 Tax=Christiangramia fulva TaxID=2126553 RepID=A0A2R3Z0T3_9FLAO|nr:HYR domain-containing protein [Christiangramia fulva]AVR43865.1 hypothetical protein C7S20_00460 [Christiangramia fulva]